MRGAAAYRDHRFQKARAKGKATIALLPSKHRMTPANQITYIGTNCSAFVTNLDANLLTCHVDGSYGLGKARPRDRQREVKSRLSPIRVRSKTAPQGRTLVANIFMGGCDAIHV